MWKPIVGVALLAVLGGCGKHVPGSGDAGAAPAASSSTDPGATVSAFVDDPKAPYTPEIEEALLLSLKTCTLKDNRLDFGCPAYTTYREAHRRAPKQPVGTTAELGAKHIKNASPAVRYQAVELIRPLSAAPPEVRATLLAAAKTEQVPGVLGHILTAMGPANGKDPEVAKILFWAADHPSEHVRHEAMWFFLSDMEKPAAGGFDKVAEKLASDPSLDLRKKLCQRLYGGGDERALDLFEKYLGDPATPDELVDGCFYGVVHAWTGYSRPSRPKRRAYELTMKLLEATPRTKTRPPWMPITELKHAKTEFKADDSLGQAWYVQVKDWYKKDRLEKALESIAVDRKAEVLARKAAVDVMKELATPKATFERIDKKLAFDEEDGIVKKHVEDMLPNIPPVSAKPAPPPFPEPVRASPGPDRLY